MRRRKASREFKVEAQPVSTETLPTASEPAMEDDIWAGKTPEATWNYRDNPQASFSLRCASVRARW